MTPEQQRWSREADEEMMAEARARFSPRNWDDEALAAVSDGFERVGLGATFAEVRAEMARRAEIRLVRGEYGSHDASWYESRQTEEQWLQEMGED